MALGAKAGRAETLSSQAKRVSASCCVHCRARMLMLPVGGGNSSRAREMRTALQQAACRHTSGLGALSVGSATAGGSAAAQNHTAWGTVPGWCCRQQQQCSCSTPAEQQPANGSTGGSTRVASRTAFVVNTWRLCVGAATPTRWHEITTSAATPHTLLKAKAPQFAARQPRKSNASQSLTAGQVANTGSCRSQECC